MPNENKHSIIIALLGATFSAVISFAVAYYTVQSANIQSENARQSSERIAEQQAQLSLQLDQLEQWRLTPNLQVLDAQTFERNSLQTTVQNIGGRHAVLFTIQFTRVDIKTNGAEGSLQTVDTGVESKLAKIDLSKFDIREPYTFTPPVTIPPGEVLTLQIKLPPNAGSGTIDCRSNCTQNPFNLGHVINRQADIFGR